MSDRDINEIARTRFKLASEAETSVRKDALEDLRFRAGEQWPDQIKHQRDIEQRPCLTINKLPSFIRQVTNEQRQNRPQIQIDPVEDSDTETAEVIQGLCRHIEVSSGADQAYDTAFEHAVTGGFGYFRILTEYVRPDSFEQKICIKRIRNPFRVYFDPRCQEPDYSDAQYAFVVEDLSHEEYNRRFPKSELAGLNDFSTLGDRAAGRITQDSVRIAEYFEVEQQPVTLHLLDDGSTVTEEELNHRQKIYDDSEFEEPAPVRPESRTSRQSFRPVVKWRLINGVEVLEEKDWPGKYIPIIPVLGDELEIDGKRELVGMVRYARRWRSRRHEG